MAIEGKPPASEGKKVKDSGHLDPPGLYSAAVTPWFN